MKLPIPVVVDVFFMSDGQLLKTWTQQYLSVLGQIEVDVRFQGRSVTLPLFVASVGHANLLGHDWFGSLGIAVSGVDSLHNTKLLELYPDVFAGDLGAHRGEPISIAIATNGCPKFFKSRPAPFALRPAIEAKFGKPVKQLILDPDGHSQWATPIVPVITKNIGKLRFCGDDRSTINAVVIAER